MNLTKKLFRSAALGALLTLLCVVSTSAENLGVGTVTADALRLRGEAEAESSILATASKDEVVVVLEEVDEIWYKVDYNTIEGYMLQEFLELATVANTDLGYGRVMTNGATLNLRSGPSTEEEQIATLHSGDVVSLLGMENGWFKIGWKELEGYASSDYITPCLDEEGSRGDRDIVTPVTEQSVEYAKQFLGVPYVWGGNGPKSFDCSGFTKYVYAHFGYGLNRTASAQMSNGVKVSLEELQPGDLVFFNNGRVRTSASHVGMYIGDGQFIHASTNHYNVEISNLSGYYLNIYIGARRIVNN